MTTLEAFKIMVKDNDLKLPYKNTIIAIELSLEALEIIKRKEVNVRLFIECKTRKEYNNAVRDLYYQRLCLTQEEYDLLKEVLL